MGSRLSSIKALIKQERLQGIILYNMDQEYDNASIYHITGFSGCGVYVLMKDKQALFVPKMYMEPARKQTKGIPIKILKTDFFPTLKKMIRKGAKIGLDYDSTTLRMRQSLDKRLKRSIKVKDISAKLSKLRETKEKSEAQRIQKACSISDDIYSAFVKAFAKNKGQFRTEGDVKAFFLSETIKAGCDKAFEPIIASGKNSSMPHYHGNNEPLKNGFLLIDFGVRYKGYNSDCTRMFYLGKPKKAEMEHYGMVKGCEEACMEFINSDKKKSCGDVEKFARKYLGKYEKLFIHGLGHGVGIKIHELPNLLPGSKDMIGNSMIFTVEPGIYFENRYGIRVEDTCILEKANVKPLTRFTKNLVILK